MPRHDIVIRIAGESGEGVISTGELLTLAAARAGFHVYTFRTYPAEIKGGHAVFQLRLGDRRLFSHGDNLDLLLAFNQEGYDKHYGELREAGMVLYDTENVEANGVPFRKVGIPLSSIAKNQIKMPLAKNMVALGALGRLFWVPKEYLEKLVREKFARKGQSVIDKNVEALRAGSDYVEQNFPGLEAMRIPVSPSDGRMVISGNEALGLGAVVAGCRHYFGYPITPASDIMEYLAGVLPQLGGVVIQAEDEIASVAMAIGVSFAGYRAMSATAGPGLSLMTELLGLAGMAEIPLVIADIQRAGPSTGMPTKTEQSDLNLAVYGNHGEAPRIVLAPADVEDCFYSTITAFNLAEKYQLPVLILSDQSLSNRTESIPRPDLRKIEIFERAKWTGGGGDHYKRYKLTETGVSPMAHPGTPDGIHVACGLEHTESGRPNYDPVNHTKMVDKRFRKLQIAKADFPPVEVYGDPTAELGIISWGSTLGAVHEATERAREKGIRICSFYPRVLYPLGNGYLDRALENVKTLIVPEVNSQGQFATLLGRVYSGTVVRQNIYGGLPFRPQTILEKIEEVAETCQKSQLSTTRAR